MNKARKIIFSALFAALCCIFTIIVRIPLTLGGFINLGDSAVLASGYFLGGGYAFFAAAVGSALADILSGYAIYAPATFLIKGLMALVMCGFAKKAKKRFLIAGGIISEMLMCVGYYVFEGFLYGFTESLVNIPANIVQGLCNLAVGLILVEIFKKYKLRF